MNTTRGAGPPSTRSRFARRAWSRRWAVLRRVLVVLMVLALLGGAGWLVFWSSVLAVEQVRVGGVRTVTPERIVAAADVPMGRPLARVDVDAVRRRVEQVPVVDHADISRSWPHTVAIDVTERTPVAVVRRGGGYRLIDDDGVMYRTVPQPRPALPVITAAGSPRAAADAAAVLAALPRRLGERVAQMRARTMDSIELGLRDGRTVVWGSAESSALKAEVLAALLRRKASVYDVSVPGAPTIDVG